jgi:flagellar assembly protein FliH
MSAPAKFLFDVDFAAGAERKAGDDDVGRARSEACRSRDQRAPQGLRRGAGRCRVEYDRRIADAMERIAANLAEANNALKAIETRLECEAVEVAVAVARKLSPALIAREPFAEISALASECFRELVAAPHIAVRVNDALYAVAREKLEDIVRAKSFRGAAGRACRAGHRGRRLPHRMG